ncbi:hypothetical protein BD413DRAFT_575132 [Trametes elegans]|nr:hypothetical protein BD413DRAFT_575132 [Trametes elegans]
MMLAWTSHRRAYVAHRRRMTSLTQNIRSTYAASHLSASKCDSGSQHPSPIAAKPSMRTCCSTDNTTIQAP